MAPAAQGSIPARMTRLIDCVGRTCQEVAPPLPLTRKEAQRLRTQKRTEIREREGNAKSGRKNGSADR